MLRFLRSKKPVELDDRALLEQYRSTERPEFLGQLYDRYLEMVYGVCLKIFRDRTRAEDAVMSIYEELLRKVKAHEIESFRGWLYVLARNHCLMELRKISRQRTDFLEPEKMQRFDAPDAAFEYELPEAKTAIQSCLETLLGLQKTCVEWFYFDDFSYKEIAEKTALEVGLVRSHIQNGRRNLRICMEKNQTNSLIIKPLQK